MGVHMSHIYLFPKRFRNLAPGMQTEYLNPRVILLHLNTSTPWGEQDEAFFAGLQAREFFQRWEPLYTVPPAQKRDRDGLRPGNAGKKD
ncbi:hypothetical protein Krac_0291 [Ktedonobacter racemifer DSM 44963]|uniref:Uncharacterized protein n=2 Tax=Ktedonobacter racemifer TaxID=363277 RepID=D6U7C2_KTERA|nr:hypothetical protein Krac_0291 [Ktedonobacter racemifer DSM 44963]